MTEGQLLVEFELSDESPDRALIMCEADQVVVGRGMG